MIRNLILAIIGISLLCRCASTSKFDYGTAYRFKYMHNHPPKDIQPDLKILESKLDETYASLVAIPSPPGFITIQETNSPYTGNMNLIKSGDDAREEAFSSKEKRKIKAELKELLKSVRRNEIQKKRKPSSYSNTHPAMQGFIIALVGFGVILASVLIGVQTLSAVMLIVGFIIIGYGLLKILMNR